MESPRIFKTDWLNTRPVFYNTRTRKISHSFNDVVDFAHIEFDPEGLNDYLDFGFSVFGNTPVKDVHFLRHTSSIFQNSAGELEITEHEDPAMESIDQHTEVSSVIAMLEERVNDHSSSYTGSIILPMSGGKDSRMLAALIKDKSRITAYTYGTSTDQSSSFEVIFAKHISEKLGIAWEQIRLGDFHRFFSAWNDLYGASVHAHGMYQMDFYDQIAHKHGTHGEILSGIIGDAWAGSVHIDPIRISTELPRLGYTHGMHADSNFSKLKSAHTARDTYFAASKDKLQKERWIVIESMRMKMPLLSYLFRVPESLGFTVWSPFLSVDIALAMLCLPNESRSGRSWQNAYFKNMNLWPEGEGFKKEISSTLNLDTIQKFGPPPLLDEALFSHIIDEAYVHNINLTLARAPQTLKIKQKIHKLLKPLYRIPKLEAAFLKFNLDPYQSGNKESKAYCAYLTLKPLEYLLKTKYAK